MKLGRSLKSAGGKKYREKKIWQLPYREIMALDLENRIAAE